MRFKASEIRGLGSRGFEFKLALNEISQLKGSDLRDVGYRSRD